MRTKGAVDVSVVAVALGGGGHRLAAGSPPPTTVEQTMAACAGRARGLPDAHRGLTSPA